MSTALMKPRQSYAACLSSCLSLFFVAGALFSASMVSTSFFGSGPALVGSGPYIVSNVFKPTEVTAFRVVGNLFFSKYSEVTDSACDTAVTVANASGNGTVTFNNFEDWGQPYGFCSDANGSASTPTEIKIIQAFLWLTFAFSFVSMFCSFPLKVASKGEVKRLMVNGVSAALGSISAIVVFSTAASYKYYKDLLARTANVPLYTGDTFISQPVSELTGSNLRWGTSFIVVVFSALLLLYVAMISFIRACKKNVVEEEYGNNYPVAEAEMSSSPRRTRKNQVGVANGSDMIAQV